MNRCRSIAVSVMQKTWRSVPFDFDLGLTLWRQLLWLPWPLFVGFFFFFKSQILKPGAKMVECSHYGK